MKYMFNDMFNEKIYIDSCVMFVTGQYNIFNNMVIDKLKDRCISKDEFDIDDESLSEFGISTENKEIASNSVDLTTFMDVANVPNISGKWFCSVEMSMLSKKQLEQIEKYMKSPSKNAVLVINSNEYREYKNYLFNKIIRNSQNVNLIQLSFPNRTTLSQVVKQMFSDRHVEITDNSAQFFVMRMSNSYNDYLDVINRITLNYVNSKLSDEAMQSEMNGIENFVLDDLVRELTQPLKSDKVYSRKVYKMIGMLIKEYGASGLTAKLKNIINDMIEFRVLINKGIIPIKVKFSVSEAKSRIDSENRLSKISDYRFRRLANMASMTSLKDWLYMKLILNNSRDRFSESGNERILYSLVHRTVLNESRLNNDIGISNEMSKVINYIDCIKCKNTKEEQSEQDKK